MDKLDTLIGFLKEAMKVNHAGFMFLHDGMGGTAVKDDVPKKYLFTREVITEGREVEKCIGFGSLSVFFPNKEVAIERSRKLRPFYYEDWHHKNYDSKLRVMEFETESRPIEKFPKDGMILQTRTFECGLLGSHHGFRGIHFAPDNRKGTVTIYEEGYRLLGFTEEDDEQVFDLIRKECSQLKLAGKTTTENELGLARMIQLMG
ncbi:MAG: hypothetical protein NTW35_01915 [Candidatus Nomurabacteria bacterium]|nr:hypothetical protein [Candidatus Nomurabacteria bacterium]